MVEHVSIQKPEDFSDKDYKKFHDILFSPSSRVDELEKICMLLAHLPTKKAQDLLKYFQKSDRAKEVEWLDIAIEEGQWHYSCTKDEEGE